MPVKEKCILWKNSYGLKSESNELTALSNVENTLYHRHSGMNPEQLVFNYLDNLSIGYERFDHPPVFTVEEAEEHWQNIEAEHCKNIFLRDAKGRQHFLVVAPIEIKLDIRAFS